MPLPVKLTGILDVPITTVERFASRFTMQPDGCWIWDGYRNQRGYGMFSIKSKSKSAHRIMWELAGNKVDFTKQLDHLCEVTSCINPKHLEQVTARENTLRSKTVTAINLAKTHCAAGHPLSGFNLLYRTSTKEGLIKTQRTCRLCHRRWTKEYEKRTELRKTL